MNKFKSTWNWIKNYKYKIIFFIFIVFVAFYPYKKEGDNNLKSKDVNPSPSPISMSRDNFSFDNNDTPKYSDRTEAYLLNSFETPNIVNEFAWNNNKIVYASTNGIFELERNTKIFDGQIQQSFFDVKGTRSLILQSNKAVLLDLKNNLKQEINIDFTKNSLKTDDNLNYVLYIGSKDDLVHIYDLNINSDKTIIDSNSYEFNWIFKQNKFYLYNTSSGDVNVYDTDLQKVDIFKINNGQLLSISSDLNRIITTDEKHLFINDTNNNTLFKNEFKNTRDLLLFWIDTNNFIVIEKVNLDYLDLYDQFLWIMDIDGKIKYLSNSEPITTKLNTKISPKINDEKTAFMVTDNRNQIWVYSLKSGYIPTYTSDGIYLYKVPDVSREDLH